MSDLGPTTYRIYKDTEEPGFTATGDQLVWCHGCNGTTHVDRLDVVSRGEEGEVTYAYGFTDVVRGSCDRSCSPGEIGWFFFDPKEKVASAA